MADISLSIDGNTASPGAALKPHTDDALLVERLRNAEENAYEELIERFQQPVFNLVYRLMNDPADASDVVQEVFLKVFRNVAAFRGQSSLKTWIYRIAVNEAHNHRRWFSRHRRQEVGLERDSHEMCFHETLSDPGRSPFELASSEETHHLIEAALEGLNPTFRTAVVLRDVEDLSYEEIADVLQINLGTVKSRILRGREALRHALVARMNEPADAGALRWAPQPAE